jgi:small-conductance mechanosensitive channel
VLYYVLLFTSGFYIAKGISKVINHIIEVQIRKRQEIDENNSGSLLKFLGLIIKIVIWVIVILMIISNIGIEITPLMASLGIGGIAVALALQTILGDLFGAFVIYFDKPFKEGDFIVIGNDMGVVKHIGIKSTRIQALQGQELVMSNTELINSRVNNYKQMEKRRIAFTFGVQYGTGTTELKKIKTIVSKIFDGISGADLNRVHFKEFGDFSLNYEVVYYVESSDYMAYMNIQEEINMKLYKEFEKAGIKFAFPTQTIHLAKSFRELSQTKSRQSKKK